MVPCHGAVFLAEDWERGYVNYILNASMITYARKFVKGKWFSVFSNQRSVSISGEEEKSVEVIRVSYAID